MVTEPARTGRRHAALRGRAAPAGVDADAVRLAELLEARHVILDTNEFADPNYVANPTNRCYFCKTELFDVLEGLLLNYVPDNSLVIVLGICCANVAVTQPQLALVLPALMLNYMGQGALLLDQPSAVDNPFFRLAPDWALYPMIILATAATVIVAAAPRLTAMPLA